MEKITDDLFYVGGISGVPEAGVLWATILELQCARCKRQERWRGRTPQAIANVARLRGWVFEKRDALCPQHSGKKVRDPNYKYIRPTTCTDHGCNDPVAPTPPNHWGRPIAKCQKHYEYRKAAKEKYLAKKAARVATTTPTIPPCNVSPDTHST